MIKNVNKRTSLVIGILFLTFYFVSADTLRVPLMQYGFGSISGIAYSHDSKKILVGGGNNAFIVNVADSSILHFYKGHTKRVTCVSWTYSDNFVLAGSEDSSLMEWYVSDEKMERNFKLKAKVLSVSFHPKVLNFLTSTSDNLVKLWDVNDTGAMNPIRVYSGFPEKVNSVKFSSDGNTFLAGCADNTTKLLSFSDTSTIKKFIGHTAPVNDVSFTPDNNVIVTGSKDNSVLKWNVSTGAILDTFASSPANGIYSVAVSPDGAKLLSGGVGVMYLWELNTGVKTLEKYAGWLNPDQVAFAPDNGTYAVGEYVARLRVWNTLTGADVMSLTGNTDDIEAVAYSPDGQTVATAGKDNKIILYNVQTGNKLRAMDFKSYVYCLAFSKDGTKLLSGGNNEKVSLWNVSNGGLIRDFNGHTSVVWSVAFSPDGTKAISGSNDNTAKLWNVSDGTLIRTIKSHTSYVYAVAFSPDGTKYLTGSSDLTAKLWSVSDTNLIRSYKAASSQSYLSFSPDCSTFVAASGGAGTIRVYSTKDTAVIKTFTLNKQIYSISYSPGGRHLAVTTGGDSSAYILAVSNGQVLRVLKGHNYSVVSSACFSPDGNRLITGSYDRTSLLWNVSDITGPIGIIKSETRQELKQKIGVRLINNRILFSGINSNGIEDIQMGIYSLAGREIVLSNKRINNNYGFEVGLPKNLSSGVYFYKLNIGKEKYLGSVVKIK